jgi:hypothetical protein
MQLPDYLSPVIVISLAVGFALLALAVHLILRAERRARGWQALARYLDARPSASAPLTPEEIAELNAARWD